MNSSVPEPRNDTYDEFSVENMNQLHKISTVTANIAAVGVIESLLVESVDAWHSQFSKKEECTAFIMDNFGNTSREANQICSHVIPHN